MLNFTPSLAFTSPTAPTQELRAAALAALQLVDATLKVTAIAALAERANVSPLINLSAVFAEPHGLPGRPALPELVPAQQVPRRRLSTPEGRMALAHSIAHIEFNAMNLALDAIWRFASMPESYYTDWLLVAAEEAQHFALLRGYLQSKGFDYGSFAAHHGLWEMVEATKGDVLVRMALVPRLMEARGLDATPQVRAKFAQLGETEACTILDTILRDEIGHVAIGNRWYAQLCSQRQLEPLSTFRQLAVQYNAPRLKPPFNLPARRAAGFSEAELQDLQALAAYPL